MHKELLDTISEKIEGVLDKEQYYINALASKYIGDDAAVVGKYLYSSDAFFEKLTPKAIF